MKQRLPGSEQSRGFEENEQVWNQHYTREKSRLTIPDENVVRFLKKCQKHFAAPFSFLDIGTGPGRHLSYALSLGVEGMGMDFAFESLRVIRELPVIQANAISLPLADSSLDTIAAWGVIHYMSAGDARVAVSEMYRVLKPGGRLLISIRSNEDTHLQQEALQNDLLDGSCLLYSKSESEVFLSDFQERQYGFISRIPVGSSYRIAHHIWECMK